MARAVTTTDRRDLLVAEGLRLVAEGGLQAVTHRSVERAAGVPHGSVTYYFESREGLLAAMVERLVARCREEVSEIAHRLAVAMAPRDVELDVEPFVDALLAWMDNNREMHLARLEFELAAVRDPQLRARMSEAAEIFWRLCVPLVLAAGSEDPERDGRAMASMVDGLLLDHLAHEPVRRDVVAAAVRQTLRSWAPDG
ncbi:TetR/AcrR family transcriptional regulator [Patulibacter defluvii]|uniref:TetR/AcrR family transcriptional regulator n=1 Tax=Patulibacter defluvii TaxID=3095358 RepID=UPI002A747365|nr:TetR family transcriptional regulator [Patulibacter sp. DM4]